MAGIVVTGPGRCGTSLVMQTLRILGYPVAGLEYHEEAPEGELHPRGEWGFPYAVTSAGITKEQYVGQAVKLFSAALSNTDHDAADKVILCLRNREATIASLRKLMGSEGAKRYNDRPDRIGIVPNPDKAEYVYDRSGCIISAWLDGYGGEVLVVIYEDFVSNAVRVAAQIAEFAGLFDEEKVRQAADNVIVRGK